MTDIQELRKLASEWLERECDEDDIRFEGGSTSINKLMRNYIAAANPATILSLIARLEKAEKDAARYRWLRDSPISDDQQEWICAGYFDMGGVSEIDGDDLDAAIDKAMESSK